MRLPFHGESVKLVQQAGEELVCPKCHNRNACLQTMSIGKVCIYECRDCHVMYVVDHSEKARDTGRKDFRNNPIVEYDAKVIGRSLGKDCYECKSFDLEQLDYEARKTWQEWYVGSGMGDKFQAARECPTHKCRNCGKEHRY